MKCLYDILFNFLIFTNWHSFGHPTLGMLYKHRLSAFTYFMGKRLTQSEVIERFREIHGDKYGYDRVEYVNAKTKIFVECKKHGFFTQTPNSHLMGKGCFRCGKDRLAKIFKSSVSEFTKRAKAVHDDKYEYNSVQYINANTKVTIACKKHGVFDQSPMAHLNGAGCPRCAGFNKDQSTAIDELIEVHGNKYDYSSTNYKGATKKINIICRSHGMFSQVFRSHRKGKGCPKCALERRPHNKISKEEFINISTVAHGSKYGYSLVEYIDVLKKVKVTCKKHGIFEQIPYLHYNGIGCPKCAGRQKNTEDVINGFKEIHGNTYDYSLTKYKKSKEKIKILCKKHGVFEMQPSNHKSGQGCPKCCSSKGEMRVLRVLENIGVEFIAQHRIKKRSRLFIVDFYLPEQCLYIEYHGRQHYKFVDRFHKNKEGLERQQKRDQQLREVAADKGIDLLEIGYFDFDNIESILQERLRGAKSHRHPIQLKLALNVA